jgi:hypothetical protein
VPVWTLWNREKDLTRAGYRIPASQPRRRRYNDWPIPALNLYVGKWQHVVEDGTWQGVVCRLDNKVKLLCGGIVFTFSITLPRSVETPPQKERKLCQ